MLTYVSGDFFDHQANIRINTVNCVGVMGAGVALAFKKRYPEMYRGYVFECEQGNLAPGRPWVWKGSDMFSENIEIINFPTKKHWRNPSKYSYIEDGLKWLSNYLLSKAGSVVTLPALGCGHGGLEWGRVRELIELHLSNTPAQILIFEPAASKNAAKPHSNDGLEALLVDSEISVISQDSSSYPASLKRFTKKDVFAYGMNHSLLSFDFSIVCSSRPEQLERELVESFIDYCLRNHHRVLMGGSAYEKKLALSYARRGLQVACFLPTGILKAARKLKELPSGNNLALLSIGDPIKEFDKSEYLPSVLSRIYASEVVMYFAPRLSWLARFNDGIVKEGIKSYFVDYELMGDEDVKAVRETGGVALGLTFFGHDDSLSQLASGHSVREPY